MKKLSKAIGAFVALIVTSSCIFSAQATAATADIKTELAATTSYYENYVAELSTFDIRGLEDVLLLLKGHGELKNKDTFLSFMKSQIEDDKTFKNDTEKKVNYDSPECYALMLLICEELGISTTDFYSMNLVQNFETSFNAYDVTTEAVNPYYFKYIGAAINHFSSSFTNGDSLFAKLKTMVLNLYENTGTEVGINYWGINGDNNGAVLPALYYLYSSDAEIKKAVDDAVIWSEKLLEDDGTIISWGTKSVNSTALVLSLLSTFGNNSMDLNYAGLLTFKDASTTGAYASDWDIHAATRDAYCGLLSYNAAKNGEFFLDYKSEVLPENKPDNDNPPTGDNYTYVVIMVIMLSAIITYTISLKRKNA